jgi:hypothetical protein
VHTVLQIVIGNRPHPSCRSLSVPSSSRVSQFDRNKLHDLFPDGTRTRQKKTPVFKSISCDKDLLTTPGVVSLRDESSISTSRGLVGPHLVHCSPMNQMGTYLVSAVTFFSELAACLWIECT